MSHIMRKPVYAICEQQRRRSACTSAQSISAFVVHCLDSISLVSICKISSLYLVSITEQAGLSLTSSQTPKTGFLMTGLLYLNYKEKYPLVFFFNFFFDNLVYEFFFKKNWVEVEKKKKKNQFFF